MSFSRGKRSPTTATVVHGATHGTGCGFGSVGGVGRPSSTPAVRRASTPRTTRSMEKQPLQYWNQQARNYDDNIFSTIDEDATGVILDVIRCHSSHDDCSSSSRCVDLGCGVGKYLPALSKHFRQVMAYDLSPKLVALALKEVKRKNLENVSVTVRDLAQVWYRSDPSGACFGRLDELESFGFGVMANVLIAPGDVQLHQLMLSNAQRSLCPGGRLLCIVPSLESALYVHQRCEEERSEGPYSLGSGDSRPSRAEAADLVKGVLRRSGVRTKHFLEPEFRLLASKGGFQVESVQRVTYHWRSELGLASDTQVPQSLRESPLPWDWLFLLHKGPLPCEGASAPTVAALLPGALRERSESEGRLPTLLRPKKEENIARMTDSQKAFLSTNRPSSVSPL